MGGPYPPMMNPPPFPPAMPPVPFPPLMSPFEPGQMPTTDGVHIPPASAHAVGRFPFMPPHGMHSIAPMQSMYPHLHPTSVPPAAAPASSSADHVPAPAPVPLQPLETELVPPCVVVDVGGKMVEF